MQSILEAMDLVRGRWGVPKQDMYFLDIGANLGTFSLSIASAGYKAVAVEPMHTNEIALRASVCANDMSDSITIIPRGLGDAEQVSGLLTAWYDDRALFS